MRDFFHGWRRKAGCVTLVMACVLMVIWYRSYIVTDDIGYAFQDEYVLASKGGELCWLRIFNPGRSAADPLDEETSSPSLWETVWWETAVFKPMSTVPDHKYLTKYEVLGIEISVSDQYRWISNHLAESVRVSLWRVPLLMLVIPLTLLSAYLIVWKPQKRVNGNA